MGKFNKNDYIIIGIDANESLRDVNSEICKFMKNNDLEDIYSKVHEDNTEFPTHINGSKRIDLLLTSKNIIPYINRTGILKFHEGFDSDHRGLFCDINTDLFTNVVDNITIKTRQIGTNSTNREGRKYIKLLNDQFNNHRIYEKINQLYDNSINMGINDDKESILKEVDNLDKLITQLMLFAERKCCKKKERALWSPTLQQSNLIIQYWNIMTKSKRQGIRVDHRLNHIKGRMNQASRENINNTTTTAKVALKEAIAKHKELLKNSQELRREYLQSIIDDLTERDEKTKTTLKSLMYREESNYDFRLIRSVYKGQQSKGVTHIMVPDSNDTYKVLTDPITIEDKIIERNIGHFGQANDTPFATGELKKIFGYQGTNINAEKLIMEQKLPNNMSDEDIYTQAILKELGNGNRLKELSDKITYEEFNLAMKKWDERTTTSPSGRHLGHYKILQRLKVSTNEQGIKQNISEKILNVYYQVMSIVTNLGGTLTRWCQVTTCMIEKIKGNPRLDKLRIIHLYEADYNIISKIIWSRKAVWNAHTQDRIHEGQCGSRPNQRSIDVVLKKEMKYCYSRLTRTNLGTIDNDAKSCFDRILCNLAMLVSRYFGITNNYCKTQATTLQNSIFKLRTALGDSKKSYQHSDNTPIHGTGQGSCASPAIWLMISSILMNILQKHSFGMTMNDVQKFKKEIKQIIEGFVDDTSIFTNGEEDNILAIIKKLQSDGKWWGGLLHSSGGKLELTKCFYYLLSWKWDSKGNPIPETMIDQALQTIKE